MTNDKFKNRIKFCKAYTKIIVAKIPGINPRRDPNYVDMSDINSDSVGDDFFEFESELSGMKASNKTITQNKDIKNK